MNEILAQLNGFMELIHVYRHDGLEYWSTNDIFSLLGERCEISEFFCSPIYSQRLYEVEDNFILYHQLLSPIIIFQSDVYVLRDIVLDAE